MSICSTNWTACDFEAHHASRSYSPHIRTNSSRWWGPKMEESRVRYSKLSIITATNRFSICMKIRGENTRGSWEDELIQTITTGNVWFQFCSDQKGAEEDKGDKVAVSKVGATATLVVWRQGEGGDGGVWLTPLSRQTGEHYLLPGLACSTPVN